MTFPIKAYSETTSEFVTTKRETAVSLVQDDDWSAQYCLTLAPVADGSDRIRLFMIFRAEEAYFLNDEREIQLLSDKGSPPYPVGCVLWVRLEGVLWQIDLPKYPQLKLQKRNQTVVASCIVQDRFSSGLIFWGDHKVGKLMEEARIHLRINKLDSLFEAVWLEPYPSGARSAICLTDHPDFDTVDKLRLLQETLGKYDIRITKGVFPGSDGMQSGMDMPEYSNYIGFMHQAGCEIAYHGFSPRVNAPNLSECLRRIDGLSRFCPTTWIDHGCGAYLFSREAVFDEGNRLVDVLTKAGVENYWSYTDVWENPAHDLNVWRKKGLFSAFSNFLSFLWHNKRMSLPLLAYYGTSVPKNLLGPVHGRDIIKTPWKLKVWKHVARHGQRLIRYRANPMVLYDSSGQFGPMSNQSICIFDTTLLNHLAFQLRPSNIDLLCRQNGLLLGHCYFTHQKGNYGTINCFVNRGSHPQLVPEFIDSLKYMSQKQNDGELVTLPFHSLRKALTNFANTSLIRTSNGWKVEGTQGIVASRQSMASSKQTRQWYRNGLYFTEVNGQILLT